MDPATSCVAPKRANIVASKPICHVMFFLALHWLNEANYANSVLTFANIIYIQHKYFENSTFRLALSHSLQGLQGSLYSFKDTHMVYYAGDVFH